METYSNENADTEPLRLNPNQIQGISSPNTQITFDTILDRIGLNIYHAKIWIIFGCLYMSDGAESLVLSFIVPIFNNLYKGE
jgi:hypothetical protein